MCWPFLVKGVFRYDEELHLLSLNLYECRILWLSPLWSRFVKSSKFRKSSVLPDKLKLAQQPARVSESALILDVATRWNSTFEMLQRFLKQRKPVTRVIEDEGVGLVLPLTMNGVS